MNVDELEALYRARTEDVAAPYLWSHDEIIEFIDDAQNEACRRAHLLIDSRSPVSVASLVAGDPVATIDPRVIHIRRARRASDSMPLHRMGVRDMDEQMPGWEGVTGRSKPTVYIPDWETGVVRTYPVPVADDDINMTVVRLPLDPIVDSDSVLEIAPQYHRALLDWMLHRGYSKADPETLDTTKANLAEAKFVAEFGEKIGAVDERWALEQYNDIGER